MQPNLTGWVWKHNKLKPSLLWLNEAAFHTPTSKWCLYNGCLFAMVGLCTLLWVLSSCALASKQWRPLPSFDMLKTTYYAVVGIYQDVWGWRWRGELNVMTIIIIIVIPQTLISFVIRISLSTTNAASSLLASHNASSYWHPIVLSHTWHPIMLHPHYYESGNNWEKFS